MFFGASICIEVILLIAILSTEMSASVDGAATAKGPDPDTIKSTSVGLSLINFIFLFYGIWVVSTHK